MYHLWPYIPASQSSIPGCHSCSGPGWFGESHTPAVLDHWHAEWGSVGRLGASWGLLGFVAFRPDDWSECFSRSLASGAALVSRPAFIESGLWSDLRSLDSYDGSDHIFQTGPRGCASWVSHQTRGLWIWEFRKDQSLDQWFSHCILPRLPESPTATAWVSTCTRTISNFTFPFPPMRQPLLLLESSVVLQRSRPGWWPTSSNSTTIRQWSWRSDHRAPCQLSVTFTSWLARKGSLCQRPPGTRVCFVTGTLTCRTTSKNFADQLMLNWGTSPKCAASYHRRPQRPWCMHL